VAGRAGACEIDFRASISISLPMGSAAKNKKSGKPDTLKRQPSVAKKLKEFFARKGVEEKPIQPLNFRKKRH
jgi:hypothetical protein